jgi:hypothetical protein
MTQNTNNIFFIKPNFEGEGVPKNLKSFIDNLPKDLFFLHDQKTQVQKPRSIDPYYEKLIALNNITNQSVPKTKNNKLHNELVDLVQTLIFPEPELILKTNERIKQAAEREKQLQQEREKEEREKQEYIEKVVKPTERKQIETLQSFVHDLGEFRQELLNEPPETLLLEFFRLKQDHFFTAKILREFETKGLIPTQNREEIVDEETAVQQFMEQRKREREMEADRQSQPKKVEAKVAIAIPPDINELKEKLKRGPAELRAHLEQMDENKKNMMEKLNRDSYLERLELILEMKQIQNKQANNKDIDSNTSDQWSEYLLINYVKPSEQRILKEHRRGLHCYEQVLSDLYVAEKISDENECIQYQFSHPIRGIVDDIEMEKFIRSKL